MKQNDYMTSLVEAVVVQWLGGLGLHAVALGSNPILTSGLDLFPVVPDSTLPCFVNSQLAASCHLDLLSLNCFF